MRWNLSAGEMKWQSVISAFYDEISQHLQWCIPCHRKLEPLSIVVTACCRAQSDFNDSVIEMLQQHSTVCTVRLLLTGIFSLESMVMGKIVMDGAQNIGEKVYFPPRLPITPPCFPPKLLLLTSESFSHTSNKQIQLMNNNTYLYSLMWVGRAVVTALVCCWHNHQFWVIHFHLVFLIFLNSHWNSSISLSSWNYSKGENIRIQNVKKKFCMALVFSEVPLTLLYPYHMNLII